MTDRRARRRAARTDAWIDQVIEAPRADLPDGKATRRARWTRRYLWVAAVVLVPSLLLNVFIVFGDAGQGEIEAGEQSAGVMNPATIEARALATTTVSRWLAADPAPLPGGRLLSWNHAEDVPAVAPAQIDNDGREVAWDRILMHDLTVTDGITVFAVHVSTSLDPVAGIHVIAGPSLVPYAPASTSGFSGPVWPGAQPVTPSDAVAQSVTQWARAFTGGDPDVLRLTVGDPDADHAYMPLVGTELVRATVTTATVQEHLLDDEGRVPASPAQLVVRVELALDWEPETDEDSTSTSPQPVTYDLLVDRADTASPNIVAWGGPGQGPTLRPYANAVAGRSLEIAEPASSGSPADGEPAQTPAGEAADAEETP